LATYKTNADGSITKKMANGKEYTVTKNDPRYQRIANESVTDVSASSKTSKSSSKSSSGSNKSSSTLDSKTKAEIKRKAKAGIPLSNATPENQALWDKYADKNTSSASVLSQLSNALPADAYSVPYEQLYRDMLASYPEAQYQSEEDMQDAAENYANLQVSSQLQALQDAMDQAGVDAKSQKKLIEAAYSGVADQLAQASETQKAQALESAISRGGGRSGVVDWSNAKINEAETEQLSQSEAQKAAQLANVANQLAALQTKYQDQTTQLEGQKGSLAQQYLQNLQNQNYTNNTNAWGNQISAISDLSGKALNSNQFNQGLTLDWTNTMGQVPTTVPTSNAMTQTNVSSANSYKAPVTAAAQQATAAKTINNDNEKTYLTNQYNSAIKSGNSGLANWAKNQAKQYGFSI